MKLSAIASIGAIAVAGCSYLPSASGFTHAPSLVQISTTSSPITNQKIATPTGIGAASLKRLHINHLFAKDKKNSDVGDENEFITKEMFLRNILNNDEEQIEDDEEVEEWPNSVNNDNGEKKELIQGKTKRKKRNGSQYKVLDNRDNLPFLVKVTTPDPYTNNEIMQKNARMNTEQLAKGSKSKKNKKDGGSYRRHNLVGMDGVDSIASSIYKRKKDGSLDQILGEFKLDKSTNCGDIVDVGDGVEYQVQKTRCQYKYVGGKKFVMTRKILEVKEVKRLLVEKEVRQMFENDGNRDDDEGILHLD